MGIFCWIHAEQSQHHCVAAAVVMKFKFFYLGRFNVLLQGVLFGGPTLILHIADYIMAFMVDDV